MCLFLSLYLSFYVSICRDYRGHHERRPSRGSSLPFIPASDEDREEAADSQKEEEERNSLLLSSQSHPLDPASSSSASSSVASPSSSSAPILSHLDKANSDSSHQSRKLLSSQEKTGEQEGSEEQDPLGSGSSVSRSSSNSKGSDRAGVRREEKRGGVEEREKEEKTAGGGGQGGTGVEFVLCIDEVSMCIKEALENRGVEPEGFHIPDTLLDPEKFGKIKEKKEGRLSSLLTREKRIQRHFFISCGRNTSSTPRMKIVERSTPERRRRRLSPPKLLTDVNSLLHMHRDRSIKIDS